MTRRGGKGEKKKKRRVSLCVTCRRMPYNGTPDGENKKENDIPVLSLHIFCYCMCVCVCSSSRFCYLCPQLYKPASRPARHRDSERRKVLPKASEKEKESARVLRSPESMVRTFGGSAGGSFLFLCLSSSLATIDGHSRRQNVFPKKFPSGRFSLPHSFLTAPQATLFGCRSCTRLHSHTHWDPNPD